MAQTVKEQSTTEQESDEGEFAALARALRVLYDVLTIAVDKHACLLGSDLARCV